MSSIKHNKEVIFNALTTQTIDRYDKANQGIGLFIVIFTCGVGGAGVGSRDGCFGISFSFTSTMRFFCSILVGFGGGGGGSEGGSNSVSTKSRKVNNINITAHQ